MLLVEEEALLQSMTHRIIEIGRWNRMQMNVEQAKVTRILRQPSTIQIVIAQNSSRMWNTSAIWVA
jgi:hypothetical protein